MSLPGARASSACFVLPALALTATLCAAREGGVLDADFLTPRERAALELERRREARPVLAVTPKSLQGRLTQGEEATFRLTVANAGGKTLAWLVASAPEWLSVGKRSGALGFEQKETVSLVATSGRTGKLPPGPVRGDVVLEAPGAAASPLKVPIDLDVRPRPPEPPEAPPEGVERVEPSRPPPEPAREPREPREQRKGAFGVRAGMLLPGSGDAADYGSAFVLGVYYRRRKMNGARLGYELAAAVGGTSEGGAYEARPATGSFNVLSPLGRESGSARGYLLSGLGGMVEFVDMDATGDSYTNYTGILNLGGGLALGGGRLDVRLAWSVLLGSENLGGHGILAVGYSF